MTELSRLPTNITDQFSSLVKSGYDACLKNSPEACYDFNKDRSFNQLFASFFKAFLPQEAVTCNSNYSYGTFVGGSCKYKATNLTPIKSELDISILGGEFIEAKIYEISNKASERLRVASAWCKFNKSSFLDINCEMNLDKFVAGSFKIIPGPKYELSHDLGRVLFETATESDNASNMRAYCYSDGPGPNPPFHFGKGGAIPSNFCVKSDTPPNLTLIDQFVQRYGKMKFIPQTLEANDTLPPKMGGTMNYAQVGAGVAGVAAAYCGYRTFVELNNAIQAYYAEPHQKDEGPSVLTSLENATFYACATAVMGVFSHTLLEQV